MNCKMAQCNGQNQMPGGGGMSRKVTKKDAETYLKQVKEMFKDEKDKYNMLLHVMRDFSIQRTDVIGVVERVKEIFKGHNNLIQGFNMFLPKRYKITVDEDRPSPRMIAAHSEAIYFVNKIHKRDENVYTSFLDVLNKYRTGHTDIIKVLTKAASLFEDHPDLLEEFISFLPG
ncbi:hypothetical protein ERO13_D09G022900v2 [Gossypium hirsutum]|nr:paired amphipathic helix protein Sin3-like 2 isoform X2 [Gossypium hirsutum]KAG4128471.1 hypothetical protein ERO13_D09G022900v2 [Gossypium hirsutum]